MNKRLCAALAALIVCLSAIPALGESTGTAYTMWGYDGDNTYRDWSANLFFKRMEERTGVRFEFNQFKDQASWTKAKADMASDGAQLPDVLFKADLNRAEERALYEAGVLIDLKPLLAENCPDLYRLLEEDPDIMAQVSLPGGQIVSLPYITRSPAQNFPWINVRWLSALRLDMPEDIAQLTETLRAFKQRDPNGNGRQDEIPLSFLGVFDLKFLQHGFGLVSNDYNIYAQDGQVVFAPRTEAYRKWLSWCTDAYKEGLLDQNGFYTSDTVRQVTSSTNTKVYGMLLNTSLNNLLPSEWISDYKVLTPLSADGKKRYRSLFGNIYTGTFAITKACAEPEKMLKWVNTLYKEDGALLASLGLLNVDYFIDGDGTWRISDAVRQNTAFSAESLIASGNAVPGVSTEDFQARYTDKSIAGIVADAVSFNTYCVLPFPHYTLTDEEKAKITELQNALGAEIDLQTSRWILGEETCTDESYQAFLNKLDSLGLPEFLRLWQGVLDRVQGS